MLEDRGSAASEHARLVQLEDQLQASLHEPIRIGAKATAFLEAFAIGAMTRNGLWLLEVMEDSEESGKPTATSSRSRGSVRAGLSWLLIALATDAVGLCFG